MDAELRGLADTLSRYDADRLRALLVQSCQTRRATELADASTSPLSTNEWKEEVFYSERLRALGVELSRILAPTIALSR